MGWLNVCSLGGWVVLAGVAWVAGGCRRPVQWRTVLGAGALMLTLGALVFLAPPIRTGLLVLNDTVLAVLGAGNAGARFLFGPLALSPGASTPTGDPSVGFILAAQVLPAAIFFASLMALLYHLHLVQPVVRLFARVFRRTLGLSGAEAVAGAANIFVGVESAVTVRPFLARMTRSELLTVMTCGMSTVASTTLAIYVLFLKDTFPLIAGHLLSASVMSIVGAVLVTKLMVPETGTPATLGRLPPLTEGVREPNAMAALAAGSMDGLRLAAGIATLLIAVLGVVAVIDLGLAWAGAPFAPALGGPISSARILGWLFTPLAWLLGVASADVAAVGRLLGGRAMLTEVYAYQQLGELAAAGALTPRTVLVVSYALCGFAHVASVGIFVGGISALAPERRGELAALGPRALVAATLATTMTGALAGVFYYGQKGLLGL